MVLIESCSVLIEIASHCSSDFFEAQRQLSKPNITLFPTHLFVEILLVIINCTPNRPRGSLIMISIAHDRTWTIDAGM